MGHLSKSLLVLSFLAMMTASALTGSASAESRNHETHFDVTFGGLEIGKAVFQISFDEKSYSLTGSGKTSGLAEWFSSASGKVESSGELIEDALKPRNHFVSVTEERKTETLEMSFSDVGVEKMSLSTFHSQTPMQMPRLERMAIVL